MIHAKKRTREQVGLVLAIFSSVLAVMLFVPFFPGMPSATLDSSWMMAVNEALAHHLVFGRDLIFTSGPLAPLYTTAYAPETDYIATWGSAFIAAALCAAFLLIAKPAARSLLIVLPFAVAEPILRDSTFLALPLVYLLYVFRLTRPIGDALALAWNGWRAAIMTLISVALWILPLVKGSFAGPVYGIGVLTTFLLWRAERRTIALLQPAIAIATLCLAWVAVGQPLDSLVHFFVAQGPIITGYSGAMSLVGSTKAIFFWMVVALLLFVLAYFTIGRRQGIDGLLCVLGLLGCLFISFKAGFVRHDGHVWASSSYLLFVAISLAVLTGPAVGVVTILIALFNVPLIDSTIIPVGPGMFIERFDQAVVRTHDGIRLRLQGQLPDLYRHALAEIRGGNPLPPINGTADVYSTNLAVLFANRLHWTPRPALQSYSAYDPSLDRADADHLLSLSAPDTVFFALTPIDGRLPAIEDAQSWPILMTHYSIVGQIGDYLQMQRDAHARQYEYGDAVAHYKVPFNTLVQVPDAPYVQASIDIEPSLAGRVLSALFKMPEVAIELTLSDGHVVSHRLIPSMAHQFLLSPYVPDTQTWAMTAAGANTERVRAVRIITSHHWAYSPYIWLHFSAMEMQPQSVMRSRILTQPSTGFGGIVDARHAADCAIDTIDGAPPDAHTQLIEGGVMQISGWVVPDSANGVGPAAAWAALVPDEGKPVYFPIAPAGRQDVARYFKHPEMNPPGIRLLADVSVLHGKYALHLLASDGKKTYACSETALLLFR